MKKYETVQGDTFDSIAKLLYGDEKLVEHLYDANPAHMGTIVFSAGVSLLVPEVSVQDETLNALPPWRIK